jgi:hypothetical protein
MKETFEQYLQRLKDRRTEDEYRYTDEDFKKHIYYIFDCYEKGMSVYKCLEFMYFAEREPIQELGIPEVPITIYKETLEEAAREYWKRGQFGLEKAADTERAFLRGGLWQAERMYSEEELLEILASYADWSINGDCTYYEWLEQFKKK